MNPKELLEATTTMAIEKGGDIMLENIGKLLIYVDKLNENEDLSDAEFREKTMTVLNTMDKHFNWREKATK